VAGHKKPPLSRHAAYVGFQGKTGSDEDIAKLSLLVESRCGAVALGSNISLFRLFRLAVP
jgi:hypothetical protein